MKKHLEIWDLNKTYPSPKGPAVIVRDFTLSLKQGEFVALIGHSGCGKSTVLSMVAGLTKKTSGAMILDNKELIGAGPDRGVVFQAPCLLPWLTAFGNVMLGIEQVAGERSRAERERSAEYYLEVVGLGHAMHKYPAELSGGMRQRVGIARAFALNPKMLLLDEALRHARRAHQIRAAAGPGRFVGPGPENGLMVTHDVDEAIFLADRVVMMTSGPAATIGEIVDIPFARPRDRATLLEDPKFYEIRERLIGFLESQDHRKPTPPETPPAEVVLAEAVEPEPAVA